MIIHPSEGLFTIRSNLHHTATKLEYGISNAPAAYMPHRIMYTFDLTFPSFEEYLRVRVWKAVWNDRDPKTLLDLNYVHAVDIKWAATDYATSQNIYLMRKAVPLEEPALILHYANISDPSMIEILPAVDVKGSASITIGNFSLEITSS